MVGLNALPDNLHRVNAIAALHLLQDMRRLRILVDAHVQVLGQWQVTVSVVYMTTSHCIVRATGEGRQKQQAKLEAAKHIIQHLSTFKGYRQTKHSLTGT